MGGREVLMKIISGKIASAKKVVVYGPEGIGKSTFAARFPDPVFIDTEGSTKDMDVSRFEKASSWTMLLEQIRYTKVHPEICRTLVIDTIDWAEQMCVQHICDKAGKNSIEDFGYGNGYVYAKEEFGRLLNLLEEVVDCGINIVLTAHAQMRKFEQPDEMGAYDRWEMKLGKKTSSQTTPLVKEWADMVLFVNYKTMVYNVDGQGAAKGKNKAQGGKRVMYTTHHPCWDAKNRYGLAEELPFDYAEIAHIIEGQKPVSNHNQELNAPAVASTLSEKVPDQKQAEAKKEETQAESRDIDRSALAESIPLTIPKALRDMMIEKGVGVWDIQNLAFARGYYPADTPIENFDPDFFSWLLSVWDQAYAFIMDTREKEQIPFN